MTVKPGMHFEHKYVDAELWVDSKVKNDYACELRVGDQDFVSIRTTQIDKLLRSFELKPLNMED